MRRIYPDTAETSVVESIGTLVAEELGTLAEDRPYVITNFASTIDGHATVDGVSGKIGSDTDTEVLMELRAVADAVMIGAGTMRTERYGRMVPGAERRERRLRRGLAEDPLAVIASASLELPWDAELFTCGHGRVLVFTTSGDPVPETETPVQVLRSPDDLDLGAALAWLRKEEGIRLLLSEGGPRLHGDLLADGLVDELFVTLAPKLGSGQGPRIVEGGPGGTTALAPVWLLEHEGEFYSRWRVLGD